MGFFLSKYIRSHYKWAILSPLFVATEVWSELAQPFYMSEIINKGIIGGEMGVIFPLGIKMLVISLIGMLGGMLSIFAAGIVAYGIGADIRHDIFSKTIRLSYSEMEKSDAGTITTCISNNVNKVQSTIQSSMRLLYRAPILFIGSIVMVLAVSKELSSVLLLILPALVFLIISISRKAYPIFHKIITLTERMSNYISELLAGMKVVRVYTQEEREKQRFGKINDDLCENHIAVAKLTVLLTPIMSLIINIGIAIIVYWTAILMEKETSVNIGEIMAITSYLTQILISLIMAQHIIIYLTESGSAIKNIKDFIGGETSEENLAEEDSQLTSKNPLGVRLEFKNIWFSHNPPDAKTGKNILKNVGFSIAEGECLGIIGGTGSGKSSIVQLILKNFPPDCGEIFIDGRNLKDYTREELLKIIGCAPQNVQLFSGSISENLRFGNEYATLDQMDWACDLAHIKDFIAKQPQQYETQLTQGGNNLSGGQRQRIALARTLLKASPLLILDDCLNGLDAQTEAKIMHAIPKLQCSKIIISQRIQMVRQCDKILVLEKGEISGLGTHEELLGNNAIYQEIYKSQKE